MSTLATSETYQPPLPVEDFTERVAYWARVANPAAYGGWETTHHSISETEIDTQPDERLRRALRIQLRLNRSDDSFYLLPICDEEHMLRRSVSVPRRPLVLPAPKEITENSVDDVFPIFAELPKVGRLRAWLQKVLAE